jgi:hypothetical protein
MRLNDGLPVWHASVTVWDGRQQSRKLAKPLQAEAEAISCLRGVGDPRREYWIWNGSVNVGHLRVPVTEQEAQQMPPGCAVHDAGQSGPLRTRRR